MKNILICMVVATLSGAYVALAGSIPLTTNGVEWGVNYYDPDVREGGQFDKLPAKANPSWAARYNTGSYNLEDSYLRVITTSSKAGGAGSRQTFFTKNDWDLASGTIVEATLRVVDNIDGLPASGAQQITYGNSEVRSYISFTTAGIRTSKGDRYRCDMTQWTTVRLVFENMEEASKALVKVYVNNSPEPVLINKNWSPGVATLNGLCFGDMNVTSGGTVDWESIRWKCGK